MNIVTVNDLFDAVYDQEKSEAWGCVFDSIYHNRDGEMRVGPKRLQAIEIDVTMKATSQAIREEAIALLQRIYSELRTAEK